MPRLTEAPGSVGAARLYHAGLARGRRMDAGATPCSYRFRHPLEGGCAELWYAQDTDKRSQTAVAARMYDPAPASGRFPVSQERTESGCQSRNRRVAERATPLPTHARRWTTSSPVSARG